MAEFVYKLFRVNEWEAAKKSGVFKGSPDDVRDGFLHFSAAHQVVTTFGKSFTQEHNLILAAVDATCLGEALKWEVSQGGEKFPHLHAELNLADIREIFEIRRDASGQPIFPPEIP